MYITCIINVISVVCILLRCDIIIMGDYLCEYYNCQYISQSDISKVILCSLTPVASLAFKCNLNQLPYRNAPVIVKHHTALIFINTYRCPVRQS